MSKSLSPSIPTPAMRARLLLQGPTVRRTLRPQKLGAVMLPMIVGRTLPKKEGS